MYPNCIYITIRACTSSIILAKGSIAHICDNIDIAATSETVTGITKFASRLLIPDRLPLYSYS